MRHRSQIEDDAASWTDKPVLTNQDLGQVLVLILEVMLDRRDAAYHVCSDPASHCYADCPENPSNQKAASA